MKYILLLFFSALSPLFILSQDCYTFQEYEAVGKQMANIDSLYKPALSSNPENSVFGDRQEEFYNSWKEFLTELNTHLSENDFSWEKKTRCFNKIYFDESGAVDTFLFNFKPGDISAEKQEEFQRLLAEFIKDHRIELDEPAPHQFSQCGPIAYND